MAPLPTSIWFMVSRGPLAPQPECPGWQAGRAPLP